MLVRWSEALQPGEEMITREVGNGRESESHLSLSRLHPWRCDGAAQHGTFGSLRDVWLAQQGDYGLSGGRGIPITRRGAMTAKIAAKASAPCCFRRSNDEVR